MSKSKVNPAIVHNHKVVTPDDAEKLVMSGKARLATDRDYALSGTPITKDAAASLAASAKLKEKMDAAAEDVAAKAAAEEAAAKAAAEEAAAKAAAAKAAE